MSSVLDFGGSLRQEKPAKSPRKGVQKFCQSGDRGVLSKGGNEHMRTLNNTEWGGGGPGCDRGKYFILALKQYCCVLQRTKNLEWRKSVKY